MKFARCTAGLSALVLVAALSLVTGCSTTDGARPLSPNDVNLSNDRDPKRL